MKVIAITGGPCAGKTSAMGVLREKLSQTSVRAIFIPEAATDLINAGIAPWTCASMLDFQTRVIELQLQREASAFDEAIACAATLIICDRGICDSHAYLSDGDYRTALASNGIDSNQALARYDAVFHLESIAKTDPQLYTRANNIARFENAGDAALVDERVMRSWSAHPNLHVIGSRESFDEKADALYGAIVRAMGGSTRFGDTPILVSACLLGEACRYDGMAQPCQAVIDLVPEHATVPVCPEQLGGLPTPRMPSEVQPDGSVRDSTGADRTMAFEAGAIEALRIAREYGCSHAILKENSPSCGVRRIYDGTFTNTVVSGMGKTAALLAENGIEIIAETDLQ